MSNVRLDKKSMVPSKGIKGAREDGLSYGEVENVIASVLGVKAEARSRMTARIRHLRNIGILSIPRPGSGVKIAYSERQAFELLLALALQSVGQSPTRAGSLAKETVGMVFEEGSTQPHKAVVWVAPTKNRADFPAAIEALY